MSAGRTVLVSITAGALLVACGSSSGAKGGGASRPTSTAVELQLLGESGIGTVLTDPAGLPLYTADQELHGTVKCTGPCLSVFVPVTGTSVTAPSGVLGPFGTLKRPDTGARQLTYKGAPLYTYVKDGSWGDATGNGVHDTFGGTHFTWHAVVVKH